MALMRRVGMPIPSSVKVTGWVTQPETGKVSGWVQGESAPAATTASATVATKQTVAWTPGSAQAPTGVAAGLRSLGGKPLTSIPERNTDLEQYQGRSVFIAGKQQAPYSTLIPGVIYMGGSTAGRNPTSAAVPLSTYKKGAAAVQQHWNSPIMKVLGDINGDIGGADWGGSASLPNARYSINVTTGKVTTLWRNPTPYRVTGRLLAPSSQVGWSKLF